MAVSDEQQEKPTAGPPSADDYDEEPEDDDYEDLEDEEVQDKEEDQEPVTREARMRAEKDRMENLFRWISTERVPLRVHDVIIKGNTKTKDYLIEGELEGLKNATSVQELVQAVSIANAKLRQLEIFDSVNITLDSGPPELPGTTNVIVEVAELRIPLTGDLGMYAKPEEFDVCYALPLGVYFNAALNFGAAAGALFPLGSGFLNTASYLPERFFLGGSPVCSLGGPAALLGFKPRGLGPFEPQRHVREDSGGESSDTCAGVDSLGGELALTAFADLSFDLPLKVLRQARVHGHAFACTGSLNKLTENAFQYLPLQKFRDSFQSYVGLGIVIPAGLFCMEVNYCYILKKHEHDQGKSGIQFSFSSPRSWH